MKKNKGECIRLLDDQVLVAYVEPVEKTAGGIYLPKTATESLKTTYTEGVITDIGPNAMIVKVGDKIVFRTNSADYLEIRKTKYYLLKQSYIACIIERKI